MSGYRPISCGAYDELEVIAMHRTPVLLLCRDDDQASREIEGRVVDTEVRDGAEYLVLISQGQRLPMRLDRIMEMRDASGSMIWRQETDAQPK